MPTLMDAAAVERLNNYFDGIGKVLGTTSRRESFATYAMGILGDGERKSAEPIASRACADPARAGADHQRLLHFVSNSPWSDSDVRRAAAQHALDGVPIRAFVGRLSHARFGVWADTRWREWPLAVDVKARQRGRLRLAASRHRGRVAPG